MTLHRIFLRGKFRVFAYLGLCFGITFFPAKVLLAQTNSSPSEITIQINGQTTIVDPPAKLEKGAVLVPLRGVLENLHAKVSYDAGKQQIVVQQGGRTFLLGINLPTATLNQIEIPLSAAPKAEDGRTYVPLRSLAELFGYQVMWQGASKTVQINSIVSVDHQAALKKLGHFGVTINTTSVADPGDVGALLDAAQKSGASFIKIRFDWAMLEPTKGAPFAWDIFDGLVRGASDRGMGVVGVLGDSTQWASIYQNTSDVEQWRAAPPAEKYFSAWDNYVRRVVGRYRKEVHAWQVWEYPASYNFRSGAVDYRKIVRRGAVMASLADPDAIVFAGDPGGVALGFLHDLRANGVSSITAGVMLHPVSQWQPGVPADSAAFLLPYSTLRDNKSQTYWLDALSFPVLSESSPLKIIFHTDDSDLINRLKSTFTPQAQANYLVKTSVLALAAGIPKINWGALRDEFSYPKVDPVNADTNSGLLNADLQPRPAYQAFATLNKLLRKATFAGALAKGPDAVVLVFSDGAQNTAVAWAINDNKIPLKYETAPSDLMPPASPQATDNDADNNIIKLVTTEKSQLLSTTGVTIAGAPNNATVMLDTNPVWITNLDPAFVTGLQAQAQKPLNDLIHQATINFENGASANFASGQESESGIYWKKYAHFRGEAQPVHIGNRSGLQTTFSRDIYNPAAGNPSIYLDVDDAYLYDEPGVPVQLTLEVYKPPSTGTGPFRAKGGFNIQYDSPRGFLFTPWQDVDQGSGTATYKIDIPHAAFTNRDGYDLVINTWGSKQDLIFRSIKVQRVKEEAPVPVKMPPTPPAPETTPASPPLPPATSASSTSDKPADVQSAP